MGAEFLLQHAEPLSFTCMSIVRQYTIAEMAVYYADRL
jgi:hypothetical protein